MSKSTSTPVTTKQQKIMMVVMYAIGILACIPWSFQNGAHNLFIFFTLLMTLAPVCMLNKAEECINDAVAEVKSRGLTKEMWQKSAKEGRRSYVPMILLLIVSGYWFMGLLWIFMYVSMMYLGARVAKRLGEGDNVA